MKTIKDKHLFLWLIIIVILISPLIYYFTGIGQAASNLPAEITRLPGGTLANSPKAEALHSLSLPIGLERMLIYPLLLLAFQLSGMGIALRNHLETQIHPRLSNRLPWLVQLTGRAGRWLPPSWRKRLPGRDLLVIALFILTFNLGIYLLYLPFNFYRGFVLMHQFGLSTQTVPGWFSDWGKNVLIGLVIEGSLWTGFFALMRLLPRRWPVLAGGLLVATSFVLVLLTPILITPLFYTVQPLEDANLRTRILNIAERAGMPVEEVYVIDASAKTTQVNAYVTGFGRAQRIVLFDTLLAGYTPDEVEVVLAHELGHWYYRHVLLGLLAMGAIGWLGLFALRWLLNRTWQGLGLRNPTDVAGLPFILATIAVVSMLSLPVQNAFSRYGENQADTFALTVSQKPAAFIQLFTHLAEQNLTIVNPPAWEKLVFYTHPPATERIRRAEHTLQAQTDENKKGPVN